jgi:hypothetical protein
VSLALPSVSFCRCNRRAPYFPGLSCKPPVLHCEMSKTYSCSASGDSNQTVGQLPSILTFVEQRYIVGRPFEIRLDELEQAAVPPRIAAVDKLVGSAFKATALDRQSLHVCGPPIERIDVERRAGSPRWRRDGKVGG